MVDELDFERNLTNTLRAHPEWLKAAIRAVCNGAALALDGAQAVSAQRDMALRCALSLVDKKRLEARTKELLNAQVVKALGESEVERKFKEKRKR